MKYLDAVLKSYAKVFFPQSRVTGAALLAASFLEPNLGLSGLLALATAMIFAKIVRLDAETLASGFYTYNPLLTGLGIGYLFEFSPAAAFFIIASSILAVILTLILSHLFSYYFQLPVLSLPFVVVTSIVYLSASQFETLRAAGVATHARLVEWDFFLPLWMEGFFKSLGAIFFLPAVLPGIIFAAVVFLNSRFLFLFGLFGYLLGTWTTGFLIGSFDQAFANILHFNFILIAVAVGGIFTIPSPRSFGLAGLAVLIGVLFLKAVEVFWKAYGIGLPGSTLTFNLIALAFIYFLRLIRYSESTRILGRTPEETLDYFFSNQKRFPVFERTIDLPFSGRWTVWQAFSDVWTHKGAWQYAYDFTITNEEGKTFQGAGEELADYYAYQKAIFAPVSGRVAAVIHDLPDNSIGCADKASPWGNYVIIHDERGFYVEISHFSENSIMVKKGDWVVRGALLGRCGNSGNSPQPHIHVQVQEGDLPGSATLPFIFSAYVEGNQLYPLSLPSKKSVIQPLLPEKSLEAKTAFAIDDHCRFRIFYKGKLKGTLSLRVAIALDGTFYLDSGKGKLFFGKKENIFYVYSIEGRDKHLKHLFLALPKLPLGYFAGLEWADSIPLHVCARGWRKEMIRFIRLIFRGAGKIEAGYRFEGPRMVEGKIISKSLGISAQTRAEFSESKGVRMFKVNDWEYQLIENSKTISSFKTANAGSAL